MKKENRFQFYLVMDGETPNDAEHFKEMLETAYVNGIEPLEYYNDTVTDTSKEPVVVNSVILMKCEERWRGAAKRFFRKTKFDFLQKVNGLPAYC